MKDDLIVWDAFERVVELVPDRALVLEPDATRTYVEARDRAERFAGHLVGLGSHVRTPRSALAGWESAQMHVAIMAGNTPAYLEAMLGCFRARAVPVNVNHRYRAEELAHLLQMTQSEVLVYDESVADVVHEAVATVPGLRALIPIGEDERATSPSFDDIVSGSEPDGDAALEGVRPEADDLCIVCTGGTTGFPKAVLWRQSDLLWMMIGDRHLLTGEPVHRALDLVAGGLDAEHRLLLGPPMMHLSGLGLALVVAVSGATLVMPGPPMGMDPDAVIAAIEKHRAQVAVFVGDAFGRPILRALQKTTRDVSSMRVVMNGGATMSPEVKDGLSRAFGGAVVVDGVGASESGVLARSAGSKGRRPGVFKASAITRIVSEDKSGVLAADDPSIGWLAGEGLIPLGYLGDPEKTAATFPVIDGRRHTVPGDRARWLPDGSIELLGRDATTINTGGEKVYADEVERILLRHPSVQECLVVGRPSQRWGQEVVGLVVAAGDPAAFDAAAVLSEARSALAAYKLPKQLILVESIGRTAVGKPDYVWARRCAEASAVVS